MKVIKDIPYSKLKHQQQVLDLYLPDTDEFSVFIYFHGGGLEIGTKDWGKNLGEYLAQHNVAVISADYRMYPTAVYPDFIEDAAEVVAWAHKNLGDYGKCRKIFVGGSSAGAYLSMMLCFDKRYLAAYNIDPAELGGFVHDAGQPTAHFNVLREKGIDSRRVIVDETAPLYYIGSEQSYAPMLFLVADKDMENRYEQTMLVASTLKHFRVDESKYKVRVLEGTHCCYDKEKLEHIVYDFIKSTDK
ncbi:MAG: alpha/beta hydrolase [Clostridia bacterium]|nr:alpha/beta hydrolase [Clostridia bacterium]